jgi:hypothetical protein
VVGNGYDGVSFVYVNDFYIWNKATNLWLIGKINPTPATTAPPKAIGGIGTCNRQGSNNWLYMFGGVDNIQILYDEFHMMTYDTGNLDWYNITVSSVINPAPRAYASLIYDGINDVMVLYGGYGYDTLGKELHVYEDTWIFQFTGSHSGSWTQVTFVPADTVPGPLYACASATYLQTP